MQFNIRQASISVAALMACAGGALAAPPNDLCANAQVIAAPSVTAGTNVAATTDEPLTGNVCGNPSVDVWYRYTHPAASSLQGLTLTTCGATWDTQIRVFTGTCSGFTQIGCNDDSCDLQSTVSVTVTPGTTYYICVAGYGGATGIFNLDASLSPPPPPPTPGPDVIVGDLSDGAYWGAVGGINAYSIGTTSCNIGDTNVLWQANNNLHPVIGQNIYRIENNRMEMIGFSWLKHGFTALTQNLCGTCSGQGGPVLGVGCSDPYVSSLNGDQSRLGPRSEVNATTGFYPYPFTSPATPPTIGRRLQVLASEIGHAGATYVGECQYTTADDAQAHNGLNNVSYRLVTPTTGALNMLNNTVRMLPALKAWQAIDPTVVVNSYDYNEGTLPARFWVAAKTVNNGNGTWTYNYTVFNLNSDRSAASFSVPLSNVTTSAYFQRTPVYHSNEPVSLNNPWSRTVSGTSVTWGTPDSFSTTPMGSALRWSTSASFSFTADTAPAIGSCAIAFFKPGTGSTLALPNLPVPSARSPCAADFNDDGSVDFFDYLDFVDAFASNLPSADFNGDSVIDFFDYLDFVDTFSVGC